MKKLSTLIQRVLLPFLLIFVSTYWIEAAANTQPIPTLNRAPSPAHTTAPPTLVPPPPNLDAKGYVLMDARSGKILAQKNSDAHMAPASLTKLMTLYLTFQALHSNQIHLDDQVRISKKAWRMGGSRMFLKVGSHVPVNLLIQGIIVASGNDACVAMAQYIAGTEKTFAQLMNQTAERLGMKNTHYMDSTGLPNPQHYSTPRDMAVLTRAIITDFPEYYHYFAQKWLSYNNIKQPNRNRLLWRDTSADGLKTGHTKAAGFCLIASAERNNMRLISVMMGTPTDGARASDSEALLNYGFRFYQSHKLFDANTPIAKRRVWLGQREYVAFGLTQPLYVNIPAGEYKNLKATMSIPRNLQAPILKGQTYGNVQVSLNGNLLMKVPLTALQDDKKGSLWTRMTDHIAIFFRGLFGKN